MLIYILGAVFLMGILVVILKGNNQEGSGIDGEKLTVRATEVQRYAAELERGVRYILQNGYSESDIRFAHPDSTVNYGLITNIPARQVFDPQGGGVEYKEAPSGVNDGTQWQFYATTHIPDVGTDTAAESKAELIAVLPNVSESFCSQLNRNIGQVIDLSVDTDPAANGCINASGSPFTGTYGYGSGNNTLDSTKFSKLPPTEACIRCNGGTFQYYRVLLGR